MVPYEIREDDNNVGLVLIPHGSWDPHFASVMKERKIDALRLSYSMGFRDTSLPFLADLPFLRSVEVYSHEVVDVSMIAKLHRLEVVGFEIKKTPRLDVAALGVLRVALFGWTPGLKEIIDVATLRHLNVVNYPFENLSPLDRLRDLQRLALTSRKLTSLSGIATLRELRELDLYNCPNLSSLDGVGQNPNLARIEVEAVRHVSKERRVFRAPDWTHGAA